MTDECMRRLIVIYLLTVVALLPIVAAEYSGTLPVIHLRTNGEITSKTDYVSGTCYIDAMGVNELEGLGSEALQVPVLVRGRGNWTWTDFDKKSYKLKFISAQEPLGMPKNRHFALLANADGYKAAFFRAVAGFKLGEMLGLEFTPKQQPVELMLNGEYMGLYMLTETIRVDENRVDITEQADGETDRQLITGGWLVEIDNGVNDHQIRGNVANTSLLYWLITYHSPEKLSSLQLTYLRTQVNSILRAVYVNDKNSTQWEELIDMEVLVRFYIVHEMLDNVEGFLGSCYMYKDVGETKWKFGPLWDLGHAFNTWHEKNRFIYDYSNGWEPCIMGEIAQFPRFQERLRQVWMENYKQLYDELEVYLNDFAAYIVEAMVCDHRRWPGYSVADAQDAVKHCLALFDEKRTFLTSQWGGKNSGVEQLRVVPRTSVKSYNLNGQRLDSRCWRGIYIQNGKKYIKK